MVLAVPLIKRLTLIISCSLLFGKHNEDDKKALFVDFSEALKAVLSIPLNLPGTRFWHGLRARARILNLLRPLQGKITSTDDVISSAVALNLRDEDILDNLIVLIIASHDTTAVLSNLMIWKLAADPDIYHKVLEGQYCLNKLIQ